MTIKLQKQ